MKASFSQCGCAGAHNALRSSLVFVSSCLLRGVVDHCDKVWIATVNRLQDGSGIGLGDFVLAQSKNSLVVPALCVCVNVASDLQFLARTNFREAEVHGVCGVHVVVDGGQGVQTFLDVLARLASCLMLF
jgi:hypothetical protein